MQTSIFDLPTHSPIAELPSAIVKPKDAPIEVEAIAALPSPNFQVGDIVKSSKHFKSQTGVILGLEVLSDRLFATVRFYWCGSNVDYPVAVDWLSLDATNPLNLRQFTPSPDSFPCIEPPVVADVQLAQSVQLAQGDRVRVLEHQFMRDRLGHIQDLHPNNKMAVVNFGESENIWCIATGSLEKLEKIDV